ncbi:uncharacterized protein M6B38_203520 [Iris pallida]|uniref:Uncharacterized protein n=1 Tax=Iris pallida TaxID=29817 RepID=A0AAX6E6W2_IRIPA|nr:uncharacterized protein M6B38_203520 [Iris pallida]
MRRRVEAWLHLLCASGLIMAIFHGLPHPCHREVDVEVAGEGRELALELPPRIATEAMDEEERGLGGAGGGGGRMLEVEGGGGGQGEGEEEAQGEVQVLEEGKGQELSGNDGYCYFYWTLA